MSQKLTITSITRYSNDKEGKPLVTKDNRPYTRLVLKAKEYGDKVLSGFDSYQTKTLKEGDTIEAEVTQNGEYLNFRLPNKEDRLFKQMEEISGKLVKMNNGIQQILTHLQPAQPKVEEVPYPEDIEGEVPF